MSIDFDLTELRLFVNIAEAYSLTKGAERTHMALPSASKRIKNLEDKLGVKLLIRTSQGATLSPPGKILSTSTCAIAPLQKMQIVQPKRLRHTAKR